MAKKTSKTPRTARTFKELCDMPRDNVETGDFWMITDTFEVTLAQQKVYESPTAKISVPRATFDAFVDWYMTGRWKAPRKSSAKAAR